MLKSIQSNTSPGHSHNGLPSVIGLSTYLCPGIILKRNNKMKDIEIYNKIKSVFPFSVFFESDDYLVVDNMVQVDAKTHICWNPQGEDLVSDLYRSELYFTVNRAVRTQSEREDGGYEVKDVIISSMHSNLKDVITKIESKL